MKEYVKSKSSVVLEPVHSKHREKVQRLLKSCGNFNSLNEGSFTLKGKNTNQSHILRQEERDRGNNRIDLSEFNDVIEVNTEERYAWVEGLVTYDQLVKETLKKGLVPLVVPELRTITVAGAMVGVGVESSSFKYGLVHETVQEMDVLVGTGKVVTCGREIDRNKELFFGIPNSYGTLGYILRLKVSLMPVKKFVKLNHHTFSDYKEYFRFLEKTSVNGEVDFLDGAVFMEEGVRKCVATTGEFVDTAFYVSDYQSKDVYYKSMMRESIEDTNITTDYLTTFDYLWRWDHDIFWMTNSHNLGNTISSIIQNKTFRKFFGKSILRSDRLLNLRTAFYKIKEKFKSILGEGDENERLVQDVGIPIQNCANYMTWYEDHINLFPIWICPVNCLGGTNKYPLFPIEADMIVDIGFYSELKKDPSDPWKFNKLVEDSLPYFGGNKALYSDNCFSKESFWKMFGENRYNDLKSKYDPYRVFPNLYDKMCQK